MGRFIYPLVVLKKPLFSVCPLPTQIKYWLLKKTKIHYIPSEYIEGTNLILQNSGRFPLIDFNLMGNSIQNGEPTPESPVPVNSVGDNVNELQFVSRDSTEVVNADGSLTKTNNTNSQQSGPSIGLTGVLKQGQYTFKNISGTVGYVRFSDSDYSHSVAIGNSYSFSYDGTSYLRISYSNQQANTIVTYKAKLEPGSVTTPYSPYGMGCASIEKCNKNILDMGQNTYTKAGLTAVTNGSKITLNGTSTAQNAFYNLITNYRIKENMVLSAHGTQSSISASFSVLVNGRGNPLPCQLVSGDIINQVYLQFANGVTFNNDVREIQLEKGTIATPYTPHQSKTYIIPTQQPMRSVGTVKDDFVKQDGVWYERHKIVELVLDGSEEWITKSTVNSKRRITLPVAIEGDTDKVLCNQFIGIGKEPYLEQQSINVFSEISIFASEYSTERIPTSFKEHINENNLIVDYAIKNTTDFILLPCTNEQSAILDEIMTDSLYAGQTNFFSNDEVPPYLKVRYYVAESGE